MCTLERIMELRANCKLKGQHEAERHTRIWGGWLRCALERGMELEANYKLTLHSTKTSQRAHRVRIQESILLQGRGLKLLFCRTRGKLAYVAPPWPAARGRNKGHL
jgi:hypothetical protein